MGRDLCDKHNVCRQLFARANAVLSRDLQTICFEGPEEVLTKTDDAQPAIFLTSLACLEALKSIVTEFDATTGLSLGEFTALTAADAVTFNNGLRMVQMRGRFMQEASRWTSGGMASVLNLDDAILHKNVPGCGCRYSPASIVPGQTIITGDKDKNTRKRSNSPKPAARSERFHWSSPARTTPD